MDSKIEAGITKFMADAQALVDEYCKIVFLHPETLAQFKKTLSIEPGSKYARVVISDCSSRSCYCFIDLTNGDILKSASWKAPAKHARGNIFTYQKVDECVGPHGANYLK